MLQVVLTTGEVVDIDGDAVTFAGPWAEFTRGPIPVASVSAEGVARIEFPSDAADRLRTTLGVSVKAWQPWTEEEDEDLARRHNDGASITALSQEFQRTYGAIRSRLIKQGRIAP